MMCVDLEDVNTIIIIIIIIIIIRTMAYRVAVDSLILNSA